MANGQGGALLTIPSPIGGWNARDSLDAMEATDAVVLDNWVPEASKVSLRKGFVSHATGVGSGDVETVIEFHSGGTSKLIAAGGGALYDATAEGAASSLTTGLSNDRWQGFNFAGKLALMNGADAPKTFDGSSVAGMTVSGTGLTTSHLIGGGAYKARTFFFEKSDGTNPRAFWYSGVNTLGGTLTKFALDTVVQTGGHIVAMEAWSRDGGAGPDDFLAFFMSDGTVIIYTGTNPGSADAWSLVGVYRMPAPIGVRGAVKLGGEAIIIARGGFFPLTAVAAGRTGAADAISDKIRGAVEEATAAYPNNFGWQAHRGPDGKTLFFNVPVTEGVTYHQYVLNTITGAWARFTGIPARSLATAGNELYAGGGGGIVYRLNTGKSDAGAAREGIARQAFTHLGQRGINKQITGLKPTVSATAGVSISIGAEIDFRETILPDALYTITPDDDSWEEIDVLWEAWSGEWDGDFAAVSNWYSAQGIGDAIGLKFSCTTSSEDIDWLATTFAFQLGGAI